MPNKTDLVNIDELAREIATEGAAGDSSLLKGIRDGFAELGALLKGKKPAPEEEEEPEEEEPEEEEEEPEEEPGDGAGFEPMGKGGDDPEFIDATDVLLAQQAEITMLRKAVVDLGSRMEELFAGVAEHALAPMAKGVMELTSRLDSREAAPVVDVTAAAAGRAGKRRFGIAGTEPKSDVSKAQMLKGLDTKIIDDDDLRWLKRGIAIPEERDGATKMQALRAL